MAIQKPFFVVPLSLVGTTSGNEAAGYPAAHLGRHKAVGLTWKTAGASNVWARGTFDTTRPVDFISVIEANALPGTTIRVRLGTTQAQVDGAAPYDSGVLPFISPAIAREDGLYHSHLELPSVQNALWWRIDIGGHTGDFQASMLVAGKKITPSKFYNWDFEYGVRDTSGLEFTRSGVMDEDPGVTLRTIDFTLAWQNEAEFEGSFRPMIEKLGKRGIVYLCFDPEPGPYRQARTYMGVFEKPPFARGIRKPKMFSQDFAITSIISAGGSTIGSGVSVPPPSAPDAPTISLTAGNGQVSIAWTDGSAGSTPITSHKLYRGTSSGSLALIGTIVSGSPYLDTGLSNGTAYFYALSAVNSVGESAQSGEQTATPSGGLAAPTATFAMTQLAEAYRPYQRTTFTGGDIGKGAGAIDNVVISGATAGTFHARLSSGGATRGDFKAAWAVGTVANGATTLVVPVSALNEWFYLDLGISDGAGGTTWLNGTTPVGVGANVAWSGQSLQLDNFSKLHDTSGTISGTGATINPKCRVRFHLPSDPATAWVLPTDAPNGARVINSAGIAEYLDLLNRELGVVVGAVGAAQGSTSITAWLPGGANHASLTANLSAGGGAFEQAIWWQGHSDAAAIMPYHTYYGHLDTLFSDLATRSSVPFTKVLSAIPNINSASWGDFKARANIRTAQERWAQANGAIYVTMSDLAMNADMVHQNQIGARRAAQHFYRAIYTASGDTGPQITSVVKSGLDLLCTASLPAGATSLVSVGTPEVRMLVMGPANQAGAALALDAVAPITITGANTFTIKLASDPGDVPLEVWAMAVHPVADASASGIFDNSNDGDGITRGRQLRFASAPALRKATSTLTEVSAAYAAAKFGDGRSGGYLTSAGPLLSALPYAGRTIDFWIKYNTAAGAFQTICGQEGVLIIKLNASGQIYVKYDNANSFVQAHGWAADGALHHVRIVQEPGNQRRHLIIDGALAQTHTGNGAAYTTTNPFRIGANQAGAEVLTAGVIDEVAVWNRAMSMTEMLVVPTAAYVGNEAGLQHLWKFTSGARGADSAT